MRCSSARRWRESCFGLAELEKGGHMVRFCGRDLGVIGRDLRFLGAAQPRTRRSEAEETQAR
jgi:hypothetical protein